MVTSVKILQVHMAVQHLQKMDVARQLGTEANSIVLVLFRVSCNGNNEKPSVALLITGH